MTGSSRNDLDVVVLDLDGGEMLLDCLTSIDRQSVLPVRVIVYDNGSRDPVASRIGNRPGVEVFRSETNLGFAGGANAALENVTSDLVALVNNDVILDPNWVETLVRAVDEQPGTAAIQSVILRPDGKVDGAGIDLCDGTIRQRGHGESIETLSGSAWGVSATAAIFRMDAMRSVGRDGRVFDESLFTYYEDVELSARLIEAGWQLRVVEAPLATHRGSSTAGVLGGEALRLRVRNRWLVHRMHPAVGRTTALLLEDVRHILRAIARARLPEAFNRIVGVIAGWTRPKQSGKSA